MTVQNQNCGAEAVGILDDECDGLAEFRLLIAAGGFGREVIPGVLLDVADVAGVAAADSVLEQFPGPDTIVASSPDIVALQARDGENALGLAVLLRRSTMHWSVSRAWKPKISRSPRETTRTSLKVRSRGISSAGSRQVTGKLDPAISGTLSNFACATISLASARL